jgi:hypothetical protein
MLELSRQEIAAQDGRDAEDAREAVRYTGDPHLHGRLAGHRRISGEQHTDRLE